MIFLLLNAFQLKKSFIFKSLFVSLHLIQLQLAVVCLHSQFHHRFSFLFLIWHFLVSFFEKIFRKISKKKKSKSTNSSSKKFLIQKSTRQPNFWQGNIFALFFLKHSFWAFSLLFLTFSNSISKINSSSLYTKEKNQQPKFRMIHTDDVDELWQVFKKKKIQNPK